MNRPYEIPYYPVPPRLAIILNGILAVVLIRFLIQTDLLALLLSIGWMGTGAVMYVVLDRFRARDTAEAGGGSTTEESLADE